MTSLSVCLTLSLSLSVCLSICLLSVFGDQHVVRLKHSSPTVMLLINCYIRNKLCLNQTLLSCPRAGSHGRDWATRQTTRHVTTDSRGRFVLTTPPGLSPHNEVSGRPPTLTCPQRLIDLREPFPQSSVWGGKSANKSGQLFKEERTYVCQHTESRRNEEEGGELAGLSRRS